MFLLMLLSGAFPCRAEAAVKNLIQNGSFEEIRKGLPDNWMVPGYGKERSSIKVYVEKNGAFAGHRFVTIEIINPNDGRLISFVKVEPDRIYKFSCRVKAEDIGQKGKGAYISVLNSPGISRDFKDTGGKWQPLEFYGRTGAEQYEVAAALRLGGPDALNTGKASFDDFRIEEVTNIPTGVYVINLYIEKPEVPVSKKETSRKTRPVIGITFLLIGFMLFFMGIYYFLLQQYKMTFTLSLQLESEPAAVSRGFGWLTPAAVFFFFLSAAFILRIILAPVIEGYPSDIACFKGWAGMAAAKGLPGFYLSESFVDYPPGYIYILYLIGLLRKLFSLSFDSTALLILIKSPAIIADMITSLIIFRAGKKEIGFASASLLSLFYAFNPAVIFDSTIYGQVDSVFVLLLLISLMFVYKDKLPGAAVVFVIAVLIKPQALIFSPVILFAFISRKSFRTFFVSALLAVVTFAVVILPFSLKQGPLWIFKLYKSTLSSYPYASLNAPNLFTLFGANWIDETGTFFIFSYRVWSFIFIITIVAFSAFLYFKSRFKSRLFYTAMFIMACVFTLCSKMHERYLFPILVLAVLSYVYTKEKRVLFILTGFSFTFLVNVAMVLHLAVNIGTSALPRHDLLLKLISFANICLLVYTVKTGIDIYIRKKNRNRESSPRNI